MKSRKLHLSAQDSSHSWVFPGVLTAIWNSQFPQVHLKKKVICELAEFQDFQKWSKTLLYIIKYILIKLKNNFCVSSLVLECTFYWVKNWKKSCFCYVFLLMVRAE